MGFSCEGTLRAGGACDGTGLFARTGVHATVTPTPMQNMIRRRAKARVVIDERLLGSRFFPRSAGRRVVALTDGLVGNNPAESDCARLSVVLIGPPHPAGVNAAGHHRVTRARREASSRGAKS